MRSPDDTLAALFERSREYAEAGTQLVWLVDPESRLVHVCRAGAQSSTHSVGDTLDGADVIPGFALPLSELFAS